MIRIILGTELSVDSNSEDIVFRLRSLGLDTVFVQGLVPGVGRMGPKDLLDHIDTKLQASPAHSLKKQKIFKAFYAKADAEKAWNQIISPPGAITKGSGKPDID